MSSYKNMYFIRTQKVVVMLSIAVYISSKLPSSMWKVNGVVFHIQLKKKNILDFNPP